jgi:hypothetical protein
MRNLSKSWFSNQAWHEARAPIQNLCVDELVFGGHAHLISKWLFLARKGFIEADGPSFS